MEDSRASLPPAPPQQDAVALSLPLPLPLPEELDDLLLNFWDAGEQQQQQQQQVAFNSSCTLQEEKTSSSTATTNSNSFYDDEDLLGSIFSAGPTLAEKGVAEPLSSSSSSCRADQQPDGLDGGATLADINARILMRPSRPVHHPVGEFACVPRVSADKPGLSGKTVSGFTRLHTPGRGTITIIRTRG
uniref:Protein XRI1 n=1 Tax=Oryza brachyantha TaxID=4533 RepID=J3MXZ4_ORYBR